MSDQPSYRDLGPNAGLIGQPGSRAALGTPALVLDLDALERNLTAMARFAMAADIALRPHAKSHKSVTLARRQLDAGAIGVCCATLGEAETMVRGGLPGVLITSPVVSPTMIDRLLDLAETAEELLIVADDPVNVGALDRAAQARGRRLAVLVDVDVGQHRTGVRGEAAAIELARRIAAADGLRFAGIQAYYGHLQHVADGARRRRAVAAQHERVRRLCAGLAQLGLAPSIVTGGGTGSHAIDAEAGPFTELQPGSYVFWDTQYGAVGFDRPAPPFEQALFVQATVVSAAEPGLAIVNAGIKSFAVDGPDPVVASGAPPGARFAFMGDEHGSLRYPADAARRPRIGDVVTFPAPHCDPTVNLYDVYHCVRGDTLVDIWPVDARGR